MHSGTLGRSVRICKTRLHSAVDFSMLLTQTHKHRHIQTAVYPNVWRWWNDADHTAEQQQEKKTRWWAASHSPRPACLVCPPIVQRVFLFCCLQFFALIFLFFLSSQHTQPDPGSKQSTAQHSRSLYLVARFDWIRMHFWSTEHPAWVLCLPHLRARISQSEKSW